MNARFRRIADMNELRLEIFKRYSMTKYQVIAWLGIRGIARRTALEYIDTLVGNGDIIMRMIEEEPTYLINENAVRETTENTNEEAKKEEKLLTDVFEGTQ